MTEYFKNIYSGFLSFVKGLQISLHHYHNRKDLVATLQYPHEKWPVEDRAIGFDLQEYNVVRSRLHVDIDDCIGCNQCMRACPVDCIKIESVKPPKGSEFEPGMTSNGSQKRMLVARFDIDLTECMFCNLCTYPCPEECIYMVGGPNSGKHQIEYEYSQRDRKDLIFSFAHPSEEDILAAGGEAYLAKKKGLPAPVKPVTKISAKPKPVGEPKINYEPVNTITDRMTRRLAKKVYTAGIRAGKSAADVAGDVKQSLTDAGKYTAELDMVITAIGSSELMTGVEPRSPAVPPAEKPAASGPDVKMLNDITDRMTRSTAKKAFMAANRAGKSAGEIAKAVQSALEDAGKYTEDIRPILEAITTSGAGTEKKTSEPAASPATATPVAPAKPLATLDIKLLNRISDKMTRGLAKKTFLASQREGKTPEEIVAEVKEVLSASGKLTSGFEKIIDSLVEKN